MKKILVFAILAMCCIPMVFGAIVTNNNQSAFFIRFPARNASTAIDAVYYNPAGVTKLADGWHFALHNQTIFQEKTVTDMFPLLNQSEYVGEVNVPFFPDLYAVYKKGKLALSFGFGPNAGGGSADYKTGLPSIETQYSLIPVLISMMTIPTTQYSVDMSFKGSSIYYGAQLNAAYAVNDMFSVGAGLRYIYAIDTTTGSIANFMINPQHPLLNPSGGMMSGEQFFTLIGQPAIAAMAADREVDVKETASGITPILSLNITPVEKLNIGVRYELKTSLEFTTEVTRDDTGMWTDGEKFHHDIPAILAVGVEYDILPRLKAGISYSTYFDKDANWDGREKFVNSNTYDIGFGVQYGITDKIAISGGYMITKDDLAADFQSDMNFELSSNTIGFGGMIKLNDMIDIDLGGLIVTYSDFDKTIMSALGPFTQTYGTTTFAFAIGFNYHR